MAETSAAKQTKFSNIAIYVSFLFVGNGCGWFVENSLWQTLANAPGVAQGGRMIGKVTLIIGSVGLILAFLYVLLLSKGAMSRKTGQRVSTFLILCNIFTFAMLAGFWDVGAPDYPIFVVATVFGALIAWLTFFALFPLISTYYGGWLIAPVRAGTDLSCLVTGVLAEVQNPSGSKNLFPMWVLYSSYTLLSAAGLFSWLIILRRGIGLRSDVPDEKEEVQEEATEEQEVAANEVEENPKVPASKLVQWLQSMWCPKHLILPIMCGTIAQVLQWSLIAPSAQIGSHMTDPDGCNGHVGKQAYRISLTTSNILVPLGSFLSSYGECPRWAFYSLFLVQLTCAITAATAVFGIGQEEVWFNEFARAVYISCVAIVAGLEGFLLTMAYRYIGDGGEPLAVRMSASSLLSFLSNVVVNIISITSGILIDGGHIACRD